MIGVCLRRVAVAVAIAAVGLSAASTAAASPRVTFYFGLKRPEAKARAAFFAAQTPGSPSYRHFSTLGQLSTTYGASRQTRRAFTAAMKRRGFVVRFDSSGVFARATGTVARFQRVFHVKIHSLPNQDVHAISYFVHGKVSLPKDVRPLVRETVLSYARSSGSRGLAAAPRNEGTWLNGCEQARATGAYSFDQVRNAYGLTGVANGSAPSVTIFSAGEGVPAADRQALASCFGYSPLATRVLKTDGQARPFGRGTFEPQEDLALVWGMQHDPQLVTFSQVWISPELWFLGASQVLDSPPYPDTFSISYGYCERYVRSNALRNAGANLLDALLVRLGLAGIGTFAAAGDFGSTCDGMPFAGVTWPASSPYLTAVGGTRLVLDPQNERVDEVAWNDLEWLSTDNGGGAGGGGFSAYSPRPPYQRALDLPGGRRAVPDVAAHASMLPGWPVVFAGHWVEDAGTSAATPLVAAGFARLSAAQRAAGKPPLGPVNGLLYANPQTLFDVIHGNSAYDRRVPAHTAGPGYDLVTGLGVPRFDALAQLLG